MTEGPRIAVLDYGIGNLRSAEKALQHVGAAARLVTDAASVEAADAVVLPGVGAFGACARALRESGLEDPARAAIEAGVPFFGVCVGFQLLYEGSVESPGARGLGIFPGTVSPLPPGVKHPQMQWNTLEVRGEAEPAPLHGLGPHPWVYFVHSFAPPRRRGDGRRLRLRGTGRRPGMPGAAVGRAVPPREVGRHRAGVAGELRRARVHGGGVMELLPAIDLRAGTAVRLAQGDFDREARYGDPAELAARYIAGGARWIHVVDLDAARTGVPHERAAVREIVRLAADASVRVQAGGGIRSEDAAAELLEAGVARVVLGTAALEEPALAGRCARRWPGRVAVGLDYRIGEDGVAEAQAQGWLAGSGRAVTRAAGALGGRAHRRGGRDGGGP